MVTRAQAHNFDIFLVRPNDPFLVVLLLYSISAHNGSSKRKLDFALCSKFKIAEVCDTRIFTVLKIDTNATRRS